MKLKLFATALTAFMGVSLTAPAQAEMTPLEIIFVKADKNGDLVLNKGEVLLLAITRFDHADSDRDNMLEKNEVGELSKEVEFSDNDANKDGALSIEEVIEEKLEDFKTADTDNNGSLTFEEVKKFYLDKHK